MPNPRDILNELKWRQDFNLEDTEIWYVHRGAKNDTKIIYCKYIVNLEKSFIQTKTAMIPYHRILKIVYAGEVIFKRRIR